MTVASTSSFFNEIRIHNLLLLNKSERKSLKFLSTLNNNMTDMQTWKLKFSHLIITDNYVKRFQIKWTSFKITVLKQSLKYLDQVRSEMFSASFLILINMFFFYDISDLMLKIHDTLWMTDIIWLQSYTFMKNLDQTKNNSVSVSL